MREDDGDDRQKPTIPYSKIERRIWSDEKFLALSKPQPCARYLWFWLLTTPELTTIPGLIPCGRAAIAEMLDWSVEDFDRCFREIEAQGMAVADWSSRLVFLPNAIKMNPPASANVVKSWWRGFLKMRRCDLLQRAQAAMRPSLADLGQGFVDAFDLAVAGPPRKASAKAFEMPSKESSRQSCPNHDSGSGVMREEGNARAREPGATAPEPPPPSSASPSPEPEPNSAPTPSADIAASVETEWKAAAASAGKPPGKASRSDRRIVADAIPDATHRAAIFAAVFAESPPKAFNLVVLDLAAWSDRVRAKAAKAEAVRGVAVNYESLPGPPEKTAEERAEIRRRLGLSDSAPDPPSTKSRAEQLAALKA